MPVSKTRRGRRRFNPTKATYVSPGITVAQIVERWRPRAQLDGPRFEAATPEMVCAAVLSGWVRVGAENVVNYRGDDTSVEVWRREDDWLGFRLVLGPAPDDLPAPAREPEMTVVDYVKLLSPRQGSARGWDGLDGAGRIRRVCDALTLTDRPWLMQRITATSAAGFFEAVADQFNRAAVGDSVGHLRAMASIVLAGDIPDPDGDIEAIRVLAGLGAYGTLTS